MRIPESDQESAVSVSLDPNPDMPGPSSPRSSNGHSNGTVSVVASKALTTAGGAVTNGAQKPGTSISKVSLPGTMLYDDDSRVDREQFVRLVIQSLRDVGYM